MKVYPAQVMLVVAERLLAERQRHLSTSVDGISTCTIPVALGLVSLLSITICVWVEMVKPQILIAPDEPAVTCGIPTVGETQLSIDRKSRLQQSGLGVQVGAGPSMDCRLPAVRSTTYLIPFPPNIANSMARSIAQSAETNPLVTPSTPFPSTNFASEITILPLTGLSICPLYVNLLSIKLRQLFQLSTSAAVKLVVWKVTHLTVKTKLQYVLRTLQVSIQDEFAPWLTPGPQKQALDIPKTTLMSFMKVWAVQLAEILLAAKVSAPSTSSIGTGQKPVPTLLIMPERKVLKQETKLELEKLAPSISKPMNTF